MNLLLCDSPYNVRGRIELKDSKHEALYLDDMQDLFDVAKLIIKQSEHRYVFCFVIYNFM